MHGFSPPNAAHAKTGPRPSAPGNEALVRLAKLACRLLQVPACTILLRSESSQLNNVATFGRGCLRARDVVPTWLDAAVRAVVAGELAAVPLEEPAPGERRAGPLAWVRGGLVVGLRAEGLAGALVLLTPHGRAFDTDELDALQDLIWMALARAGCPEGAEAPGVAAFERSVLASLTEASVDGILVVSNEGDVLLRNDRFVALWNIPPDIAAMRDDECLLQAVLDNIVDPEEFRSRVGYLYEHPDECSRENITLKDGRILDRYSAPVRSSPSERLGRVWFFRDISAQVRALRRVEELAVELASQHKWLEGLLDVLPVPVLLVDAGAHDVIFANAAADRAAGGSLPRVQLRLEGPVLPLLGALVRPVLASAQGQGVRAFEAAFDDRGKPRNLLVHAAPFSGRHGHEAVVVVAFDDISALKETQGQLQQAVRARDEFLSIASHELKTPVTAINLQVQSMVRTLGKDGPMPERAWFAGKMHRVESQLHRLTRLIDNLLDVSRITAGRLEFENETVDLAEVVRESAERLRDEASRAGAELRVHAPEAVVGCWDRLRLEQVIVNLLTNALKYGDGKPIELHAEAVDGHGARLSVRDHGIGISAEHQARIFERFERAVSERQYGGLGLGLWITRQIVEGLGGTIAVLSVPQEGSTFTVNLPRQPHTDPGPPAAAS